jgi:hypothetical protein
MVFGPEARVADGAVLGALACAEAIGGHSTRSGVLMFFFIRIQVQVYGVFSIICGKGWLDDKEKLGKK